MSEIPEETLMQDHALAAAFEALCVLDDDRPQEYVISHRMSKPESFRWFIRGVAYERSHQP